MSQEVSICGLCERPIGGNYAYVQGKMCHTMHGPDGKEIVSLKDSCAYIAESKQKNPNKE